MKTNKKNKLNKYWNPARFGPKQDNEVPVYTVAIANLPTIPTREIKEFVNWLTTLDGFIGLRPEYPHGTLLLFETENQAKIARNRISTYKGGVQTGNNICEVFIDAVYVDQAKKRFCKNS